VIEVISTMVALVSSAICIAWACATYHPREVCPPGWWIPEGVRRTGEFVCRPAPRGVTERDHRGVLVDHSSQPAGELEMHVTCGGTSVPVIDADGRTVSCR
jgi:hypothetical protein